ncbi:MAG: HAMP domain-containing histidine kinase [Gammaproteobacteria bacterium]|nr:HAMP domain-containing histidine kinase [Gammaproteobacteria bacterium]
MKNSLAMLLGSLEEVSQQCMPTGCPSQKKLLRVQHEGRRVNRDLIQLLALYRMDNDQYFLNVDEQRVEEILEDIALDCEELLASHGIQLQVDVDEGLTGYFDRDLVSGVINTVIHNAYQYTRDIIFLSACEHNHYLMITVKDNGPGYPENMLCSRETYVPGVNFGTGSTGLGLYFASRVAALHENRGRRGYTETSNDGIDNNDGTKGGRFALYLP